MVTAEPGKVEATGESDPEETIGQTRSRTSDDSKGVPENTCIKLRIAGVEYLQKGPDTNLLDPGLEYLHVFPRSDEKHVNVGSVGLREETGLTDPVHLWPQHQVSGQPSFRRAPSRKSCACCQGTVLEQG